MDTSAGRLTEARGLPRALPAYDPRDMLAWVHQKYRSRQHYQPVLYQGHHHLSQAGDEAKLTVRPCGKTRRPHASPSRVITGRGNPNWLLPSRLAPANRLPTQLVVSSNRRRHTFWHSRRVDQGSPSPHTGTGLTQRTSAVYAIWWWWWWFMLPCKPLTLTRHTSSLTPSNHVLLGMAVKEEEWTKHTFLEG